MEDERLLERERRQYEQIRELDLGELQVEEVDDVDESSEEEGILERERRQIEEIRELEFEELQVEEVDGVHDSSEDDRDATGGNNPSNEFTFNTGLASLHTYLGEVEDTHNRLAFLEGGSIFTLPLFYLQGVVLFPEATLPLRVIQPNCIVAVERALTQADAPYTIGVVRVYRDPNNGGVKLASTGTTAEIRQYRRLEDGSLNVLTHGQQRFRLKRHWFDVDGVPCGKVQIIQEDLPLRTPQDACGKLGPVSSMQSVRRSQTLHPSASSHKYGNDSEDNSEDSFECALSSGERRIHQSVIGSSHGYDTANESTSEDDDKSDFESDIHSGRSHLSDSGSMDWKQSDNFAGKGPILGRQSYSGEESSMCLIRSNLSGMRKVPKAFWPFWVYRMYDSYCLAQRAADKWKQIVGAPKMDDFVKKPDVLSFYIASKLPVSESTRQELLEIDGISYRLRREIELLDSFNTVRCKTCQTAIAKRSDMLVMSSDGPLNAYVNPGGCVHEIMTLYNANGLALLDRPRTEYSWFPGYAWTIATCGTCEIHMGWLFTAMNKKLKPKSFWGIRSAQVADSTH